MMKATIKARKIGGSIGIIIPKKIVENEHISPGDTINIKVEKTDSLESLWGSIKIEKKSTDQIMREIDEGEEW